MFHYYSHLHWSRTRRLGYAVTRQPVAHAPLAPRPQSGRLEARTGFLLLIFDLLDINVLLAFHVCTLPLRSLLLLPT